MMPRTLQAQLDIAFTYLPTGFAKLAFLAAMRNPYNGRYMHDGWLYMGSPKEIHILLRDTHIEIFDSVSCKGLPDFCDELKKYLCSLTPPPRETARLWNKLEPYREMVPEEIPLTGRAFFVSQMRAALTIFLTAPDWPPASELFASRRRRPDPQFQHRWES